MGIFVAPSDLWPGANDADVEDVVKALSARGFPVYVALGRGHGSSRPLEQRFGVVVDVAQAYQAYLKTREAGKE